jgi:hypothetical protein
MSFSIFDLLNELNELRSIAEAEEGVLDEQLEERFTINRNDAKEKIGKYYGLDKALSADNLQLKDQIKRLEGKIKINEKLQEKLKSFVALAVKAYGTSKTTPLGNTTYKFEADGINANLYKSQSLKVFSPAKLPSEWINKKYIAPDINEKQLKVIQEAFENAYDEDEVLESPVIVNELVKTKELKEYLVQHNVEIYEDRPELPEGHNYAEPAPLVAKIEEKWNVSYK